eukprot:Plantae.Rhodophyta-Hildenbrandia_rubra.ctg24466.p1 GENE.Plantae.Rhodophyta-Hildenbrandia_rubra.ctg24466~~Plantae.Rhodophyta-Hildenbrandia_rubra.ctg24466.p1  ORF type:complete len:326 (-),score=69.41 Plantae.Rhodophyta-Hildenbrandia_rubra.ctg24466:429-1406(-)
MLARWSGIPLRSLYRRFVRYEVSQASISSPENTFDSVKESVISESVINTARDEKDNVRHDKEKLPGNVLTAIEARHGPFIKYASYVVDLGAAPGVWSRYVAKQIGLKARDVSAFERSIWDRPGRRRRGEEEHGERSIRKSIGGPVRKRKHGKLVCVDKVQMNRVLGAAFVQGDFREKEVLESVAEELQGYEAEIVLSDCGSEGEPRKNKKQKVSNQLAWSALKFAHDVLKCGGTFVCRSVKAEKKLRAALEDCFCNVKVIRYWSGREKDGKKHKSSYYFATGFVPLHLQGWRDDSEINELEKIVLAEMKRNKESQETKKNDETKS